VYVKVCGLVNTDQIDQAIAFGYDAIGVVTYPKSNRYCPTEKAIRLAEYARGKIESYVVGLRYRDVKSAADAFDYVQIYEGRQMENLAFASDKLPPEGLHYAYFVYDASLGSGEFKAFPSWLNEVKGKLIVAGGLSKENVCSVIRALNPFGVDVSSGVEKDGVKDSVMMKGFMDEVKCCV